MNKDSAKLNKEASTNRIKKAVSKVKETEENVQLGYEDSKVLENVRNKRIKSYPLADDYYQKQAASYDNPHIDNGSRFDDDSRFENEHFNPQNYLVDPEPREGMVQRWVRANLSGARDSHDIVNYSRKQRMGWRPRPAETIPESFHLEQGSKASSDDMGVLQVAEMVLMEMPEGMYNERIIKKNKQSVARTTRAIDEQLGNTQSKFAERYGTFQWDERKVTATRGRQVKVADD